METQEIWLTVFIVLYVLGWIISPIVYGYKDKGRGYLAGQNYILIPLIWPLLIPMGIIALPFIALFILGAYLIDSLNKLGALIYERHKSLVLMRGLDLTYKMQ